MNRRAVLMIPALGLAFAAGFTLAARMQSGSGEVIPRDVVAAGGGRNTTASGHVLNATIGQPVVGVSHSSDGTILVHGFHTMTLGRQAAARNWQLY